MVPVVFRPGSEVSGGGIKWKRLVSDYISRLETGQPLLRMFESRTFKSKFNREALKRFKEMLECRQVKKIEFSTFSDTISTGLAVKGE